MPLTATDHEARIEELERENAILKYNLECAENAVMRMRDCVDRVRRELSELKYATNRQP